MQRSVYTGPGFRTGGLAGLWMLPASSSVSPAEAADPSRRSWCKARSPSRAAAVPGWLLSVICFCH